MPIKYPFLLFYFLKIFQTVLYGPIM